MIREKLRHLIACVQLTRIISVDVRFRHIVHDVSCQLRIGRAKLHLDETRASYIGNCQIFVKLSHQAVFIIWLGLAPGELSVFEVKIVDDLPSQSIALQNSDLSVDCRPLVGILRH